MNKLQRFVDDGKFRLGVICLGWFCWWLVAVLQSFFATIGEGHEEFVHRILDYGYVGIIWAAVTPLVIYLARIITYDNNLIRVVSLHVFANLGVLVVRTFLYTALTNSHFDRELNFIDNWLSIIGLQTLGNVIIYGLIVAVYYSIVWYLEFKDSELRALQLNLRSAKLEHQLAEANLTALRMQLNPHFLFNTLHSVASLIRVKKNDEAIETLSTLSELLRSTVYEGKYNQVTVRQEIEFVKKYLSIEQLRFAHRLEVNWDVEPGVLGNKIPNLLLQPLVENALKHGLKETKSGTLSISVKNKPNNRISFLVTDNGAGLPKGFDLEKTTNVGLKNTVERLYGTYDTNYEFSISENEDTAGTTVKLVIPAEV